MVNPEKEPEIAPFDPTGMSVEERLARLEQLYETVTTHQATMGKALIEQHGKILTFAKELEDGGVREAAEFRRAEKEGRPPTMIGNRPAPLVMPGRHPLSKG